VRRLALAAASVVVTLILTEVVLRVTGFGLMSPELSFGANTRDALSRGQFVPDPVLFWTLPPGATTIDRAIGAVHPRRPLPPDRGVPRVLLLGDSCTRLAVDSLPYPAMLQEALGSKVEILTAAVPGYSSYQGLAWLRSQLLAVRPDLVVVYFGWNDHWRATGRTDRDYAASLSPGRLRLLSLLRRRPTIPPLRVPADDYRANLTAIVAEVTAAGGRVLFVRAPSNLTPEARGRLVQTGYTLMADDPVALHRAHLRILDDVAAAAGAAVLDADAIFAGTPAAAPLLHRDGIHLTAAGHRLMATILAETIARDVLHESGRD
jgi:lysophospholipase L1-like esterase